MKKTLAAFLLLAASLSAAQFKVTVDTSFLDTLSGTVDIQFNPGSFPDTYESGTATITGFSLGTGALGTVASGPDGGASGSLPGPLTLTNSDFLNGIVYNATFGSTAEFFVDFTGNAFTASGQSILSSLSVSFIGQNDTITGIADLIGDSQIDTSLGNELVSWAEVPGNEVPEASTFALLGLGLAAAAVVARRR